VWNGAEGLVVDADGVEVPAGDTGELVVRTPTLMRGYWGRPDLDARAFLVREDAGGARNVFYRTGDVVRERPDGQLVFLGRRDRQVKVRGYRIELDEVESAMAAADAVAEAAAVALPAAEGQLEIVAAVLLRPGATATGDMLRRRAGERLPPYAVPQRVEFLKTFPRTGTGKIDRPALAAALAQGTARDRT
jgi:acyl-coenzyme A synthetase/AMP-(fatty) acid ligase